MKGSSNTIGVLLILVTMLSFASAGSNYQNLENFKLMTLAKVSKVFYTGDTGVIEKKLFYTENGISDCMDACHGAPTCESFNLAESKPGEWYCELTTFRPTDTAYAVPQEHDGFDNYSFTMTRASMNS